MYVILKSELGQVIKRLEDNAFIPFDEDNVDYQEYLKWIEQGNIPEEENI